MSEIGNRVLLEAMLAREEEVKRRAVIQKEVFEGPQIRFHSKEGETRTQQRGKNRRWKIM